MKDRLLLSGQVITSMRFDVITLFPDLVEEALRHGITGRAIKKNLLILKTWNPRDFTDSTVTYTQLTLPTKREV